MYTLPNPSIYNTPAPAAPMVPYAPLPPGQAYAPAAYMGTQTPPLAMPVQHAAYSGFTATHAPAAPPAAAAPLRTLVRANEANLVLLCGMAYDASSSMSGSKITATADASVLAKDEFAQMVRLHKRCRLYEASFNDTARTVMPWTDAAQAGARPALSANGCTDIYGALMLLHSEIGKERQDLLSQGLNPRAVALLMSDGGHNGAGNPEDAAKRLRDDGIILVTLAFGSDADFGALQRMAYSPAHAYTAANPQALKDFFQRFGKTVTQSHPALLQQSMATMTR